MWQSMGTAFREVACGHLALVLCIILNLVWWCIVFKPGGASTAFSTICIVMAALAGVVGVALSAWGMSGLPARVPTFPSWWIAVGGIVLYVVALYLTSKLLHRQVTTELFLIIGFGVLELYTVNAFYGWGTFSAALSWILAAVLVVVVAVSIVCYLRYYDLGAWAGWVCGMIPLIAAGVYLAAMVCVMLVTGSAAAGA